METLETKSPRRALQDLIVAVDSFFFGGDIDDAIKNLTKVREAMSAADKTIDSTPEDDSQTVVLDVTSGKPIATFADTNLARWFADECEALPNAHLRIVEVES
jgi:hypothetical protein